MVRFFFLAISLAIFVLGPMTTKAPHTTAAAQKPNQTYSENPLADDLVFRREFRASGPRSL